jgi:hypothetical protein
MAGEGASVLHPGPFRSVALRQLAGVCPHCMGCGKTNDGSVVLAHSNRLKDGKGKALKAHDVPCYVCKDCHEAIDLHGDDGLRLEATYASMVWLLQSGYLQVVA